MHLIIMRHGEAAWHTNDQQRELTETGRRDVADVAARLAESPYRPEAIWCSPLLRAQQTAAIVSEVMNCAVEEKPFITPDDDPGKCLDALLEQPLTSPLLIVSHMPLVGALATLLVDAHRRGLPFMPGEAVVLDMPVVGPGCADLKTQFLP
ncbi:MAG: phosphohistidine phosphatase SixA [Alteromonadaceae bacterium]|nr:phosphohistidine phosphatase SixA [Alteromonadaceae bacterium]